MSCSIKNRFELFAGVVGVLTCALQAHVNPEQVWSIAPVGIIAGFLLYLAIGRE